ncbi:undecaprenyl-diphosphate phosphatase [bacterium]|nr:undecaprenyl-diphosphate phosphatase [bacterium]MCI0604095.1 undecaprenyl-diphosphate phosphatase [bacterium]
MTLLDAILLGIIEGITEFLPVSSTGHLILASAFLKLQDTEFLKSFEIAIQLGAILSVVVLYARSLLKDRSLVQKTIVAFLPTCIIGLIAYGFVKRYLLGNELIVVAALLIGGLILILFEWLQRGKPEGSKQISYPQALYIGLFQCVSMIPGVSRSAATIIGGMVIGIERKTIVEFSFLLAIPTMAAATALDIYKSASRFSSAEIDLLLVGFVTSFVVALLSIKFLLRYIQNHTFIAFGIYRILVAFLFWTLMM